MPAAGWWAFASVALPALVSSIPLHGRASLRDDDTTRPFVRSPQSYSSRRINSGTVALEDRDDVFYTVPVTIGSITASLNIDTGSSDLWVISSACGNPECAGNSGQRLDDSDTGSFKSSGVMVNMLYGDSSTGSHARGRVGRDTVTLAGLTMENQTLAAVDDTNNYAISNGASGVFGLGFPAQRTERIGGQLGSTFGLDFFVKDIGNSGPLSRNTLQRNHIDISGEGALTIGRLPGGIDESDITWVPVRLYSSADGGLSPPSFAPDEVYPLRWEVELDAVFLDGEKLPGSTQPADGVANPSLSALIDTGNSVIRGPPDVVDTILSRVSPTFAADPTRASAPFLPCTAAHSLAFQIGGKLFPVDPRDFVAHTAAGDGRGCIADNIVGTDAPSPGALFSWVLGDPFLKSNLVVFYYGNLTHPSVDPPRIGFVSLVPPNADELLRDAVGRAASARM
ncbi:acid protease [Trametes polyzona]|nr:acid protease [Trametes polyzona]